MQWWILLLLFQTYIWLYLWHLTAIKKFKFLHHPPGARNHHYYILFLFSLLLMGIWMFYGCLMCEWHVSAVKPQSVDTVSFLHGMIMLCVSYRLVKSLCAALWGAGPVGRRLCPGLLFSLAARHLRAGLLSHLLDKFDPAAAALPGGWIFRAYLWRFLAPLYKCHLAFHRFFSNVKHCLVESGETSSVTASHCIICCFWSFDVQIAFLGLTTAERASLSHHQRKLRQNVSLRQNPYKWVAFFNFFCKLMIIMWISVEKDFGKVPKYPALLW